MAFSGNGKGTIFAYHEVCLPCKGINSQSLEDVLTSLVTGIIEVIWWMMEVIWTGVGSRDAYTSKKYKQVIGIGDACSSGNIGT